MKLTDEEKLAQAKLYLGTKHVLHPKYDGKHTVQPHIETDISRTFKRIAKAEERRKQSEAEAMDKIMNIRQINKRSA